jgi:hypothetical protein
LPRACGLAADARGCARMGADTGTGSGSVPKSRARPGDACRGILGGRCRRSSSLKRRSASTWSSRGVEEKRFQARWSRTISPRRGHAVLCARSPRSPRLSLHRSLWSGSRRPSTVTFRRPGLWPRGGLELRGRGERRARFEMSTPGSWAPRSWPPDERRPASVLAVYGGCVAPWPGRGWPGSA